MDAASQAFASPVGRLRIHCESPLDAWPSFFGSPLQRLRALYAEPAQLSHAGPMRVRIDDLQGRNLLTVDDPGPLIDMPLPPGTYDVTVTLGRVLRRYTLTLAAGAPADLHLRFGAG